MAKKSKNKKKGKSQLGPRRSGQDVHVRYVAENDVWEFLHPRCALDRAEDIEEVETMFEAGEGEIAKDELRQVSRFPDFRRPIGRPRVEWR